MYRHGHLGIAMLALAPVAFGLLSAGLPLLAVVVCAVVLQLATLPDVDHRLPFVSHRGPTHSLAFAALVGGLLAGAAAVAVPAVGAAVPVALPAGLPPAAFGFLLGFGAVFLHLLGDVITPMGVNFLWPYPRAWSLSWTTADSRPWNAGLFALGVFALAGAVALALRGVPF